MECYFFFFLLLLSSLTRSFSNKLRLIASGFNDIRGVLLQKRLQQTSVSILEHWRCLNPCLAMWFLYSPLQIAAIGGLKKYFGFTFANCDQFENMTAFTDFRIHRPLTFFSFDFCLLLSTHSQPAHLCLKAFQSADP